MIQEPSEAYPNIRLPVPHEEAPHRDSKRTVTDRIASAYCLWTFVERTDLISDGMLTIPGEHVPELGEAVLHDRHQTMQARITTEEQIEPHIRKRGINALSDDPRQWDISHILLCLSVDLALDIRVLTHNCSATVRTIQENPAGWE